ncbi:MAG TPA: NAD(P)H-hydrate dehydratase [Ktedonobacteraceae bacterium]
MHIVTIEEMRVLESRADREYGLNSSLLMETAGKSAAELLARELGPVSGLEFLLLIGPGNNGGDGLVIARHLQEWGGLVNLYYWKERRLVIHNEEVSREQTAQSLEQAIKSSRAILDALLGIGRARPLPDDMRALLQRVHEERNQRETLCLVAIDLPTGMNADTGEVDPGTIPVDLTITLACPKQGFFFFPARGYLGKLLVGSIGLPPQLEADLHTEMLTDTLVRKLVPERPLESNKGTFGKAMLLCGSLPYPGSAFLAGSGAARTGAGLITMAVTEQMLPIYADTLHEATFLILPPEEEESHKRVDVLMENIAGYRSLLLGPGLGQSPYTREVILYILERLRAMPVEQRPRLVIDADGLNNLSALEYWWTLLPPETVITPHPGEMGRLCKDLKVSGGSLDRLDLARAKASEWKVTLVLKGACTIITQADHAGSVYTRINWKANPAMASAGTGDVLAGMTTGFLAQGLSPFNAASAAVYLHASAGERISAEIGQAGLLASDLLSQIPRALHNLNAKE